jgi:hypothetical protein
VTESFDWWSIAERLAQLRGEVLRAEAGSTASTQE